MKAGIRKVIIGCFITASAMCASVAAQDDSAPRPKPAPAASQYPIEPPARPSNQTRPELPKSRMYSPNTHELSIAVSPTVNVTLCVAQGDLRINGWRRDEVRVYIRNGGKMKYNVREKNERDGKANWVSPAPADPKNTNRTYPECIWGEYIEIDLPFTAAIEIKGTETEATIEDVRKVYVKNVGGDITVRNAKSGVTALTYEGDVTVEGSAGQMNLETTSGNITAFQLTPVEIGDRFKAKNNSGSILLQNVAHRQTEVTSISGSVAYTGEIRSGGAYNLSTTNGSIRMTLPATTNCQVSAIYGFGTFASDIPLTIDTENIAPGPIKMVQGKIGTGGDAILKLTANNGSIGIKKN